MCEKVGRVHKTNLNFFPPFSFIFKTYDIMTKLEKLQLETDIQKWINWNVPDFIEEKFLELMEPRMKQDEFLVLLSKYKSARLNPDYRTINDGMPGWNSVGTRYLAGLLHNFIELLDQLEKSKDTIPSDFEFKIKKYSA